MLLSASGAFAQGGSPVFQPRYVPEYSPTPAHRPEAKKPIPRFVIIGVGAIGLLAMGVLLFFASKAWRTENIFESKYRFPPAPDAALRFGGNRSGGAMAAIEPEKTKREA